VTHHRPHNGDRTGADQIHLPGPSLLPLFAAIGLTTLLLGLILSWLFIVAGGAITLLVAWRWISTARDEYQQLPRG
jgi:hypothetical protein